MSKYYTKEQWALAMRGLAAHVAIRIVENNTYGVNYRGCNKGEICDDLSNNDGLIGRHLLGSQEQADQLKKELEDEPRPNRKAEKAKREAKKKREAAMKACTICILRLRSSDNNIDRIKVLKKFYAEHPDLLPMLTEAISNRLEEAKGKARRADHDLEVATALKVDLDELKYHIEKGDLEDSDED